MATPNYGYEKRQKELAKRLKKEEKLRSKADRKHQGPGTDPLDSAPEGGDHSAAPSVEGGAATSVVPTAPGN